MKFIGNISTIFKVYSLSRLSIYLLAFAYTSKRDIILLFAKYLYLACVYGVIIIYYT